ncbi:MAG: cbb3-type cytochrome oxidase assembly protein CcoS [Planctomycetaceae bacterium]|nr:cbb3-type cytochrome oxidase assembly protein CcoS [Planctomycetaceae bacterium]MCP4477197.1 cbb3-type cytochrome oxidase assembly protein CcoS [Planctomycetaceae bacterium]MCP4778476.1 cbb3-type cytochrome oxidase assembly protein CcoS [Planctomycetaceae bacterium]
MSVLYIAVPLALVVALIAIIAFVFQVRGGQYDDLQTPAHRVLVDDVETEDRKNSVAND